MSPQHHLDAEDQQFIQGSSHQPYLTYGPHRPLVYPKFVKETGELIPSTNVKPAGDSNVGSWYRTLTSSASSSTPAEDAAVQMCQQRIGSVDLAKKEIFKPVVPLKKSSAAKPSSSSSSSAPNRRQTDPHWFISRSLPNTLVKEDSPKPSLSLVSQLNLPAPGEKPLVEPPPHFHLDQSNKGYQMIEKLGWAGRELGRNTEKRKLDRKREEVADLEVDVHANVVDLTAQSDSDEDGEFSTFVASSSSSSFKPTLDNSGRKSLLAPIPTILLPSKAGLGSKSATIAVKNHRAITHSAQSIQEASRRDKEEVKKLSGKEIRKKAKMDNEDRMKRLEELGNAFR